MVQDVSDACNHNRPWPTRLAISPEGAPTGMPRTNADKRRAVETLLRDEEWSKKSDRWIAEKASVSPDFASRMRRLSSDDSSPGTRKGRDGKARTLPEKKAPPAAGAGLVGAPAAPAPTRAPLAAAHAAINEPEEVEPPSERGPDSDRGPGYSTRR